MLYVTATGCRDQLGVRTPEYALPTIISSRPASLSELARYDGARYGLRAIRRARAGGYACRDARRRVSGPRPADHDRVPALPAGFYDAYYTAQKVRTLPAYLNTGVWETCDVILCADRAAGGVSGRWARRWADPLAMYLNDVFAVPMVLRGCLPIPAALNREGLPLGLRGSSARRVRRAGRA